MAFIEINNDKYSIDDSDWEEKHLIDAFMTLIKNNGFDEDNVSCGVTPGPDFGYFTLASRFWRASLCIYFSGTTQYKAKGSNLPLTACHKSKNKNVARSLFLRLAWSDPSCKYQLGKGAKPCAFVMTATFYL